MTQSSGIKIKKPMPKTGLSFSTDKREFYFLILFFVILIIALVFALPQLLVQKNKISEKLTPQGIHVQGNKIVDSAGEQVILHGVNRSGTEYECVRSNKKIFDGPNDLASIRAIKSWGINAVRVPLNEDCWLGINGAKIPSDQYQKAIVQYVNNLSQVNTYVILDLHWNAPGSELATGQHAMADKDHALTFWKSIATRFKDNQNVIFDLYNEPRDISWSCWRDGTDCSASFDVASMQDMINTVRQTGATNLVMLGGLDYASDLSGWLDNMPNDPAHNLVASWHMYGKKPCDNINCWDKTIAPLMKKVPVIAGEFGESYNNSVCGTKTSNDFMQWMDKHYAGYLAWTWDAWSTKCGDLSLITNYNGTPKDPNGTNYKNHLERF